MYQNLHKARREAVFNKMADNSIALLSAAQLYHRNGDAEFPFRQDSYFYYLTGFDESTAIAVLSKKQGICRYILFCQDKDPKVEQWTGARVGIQDACKIYGADEAYISSEAFMRLPLLISGTQAVYYLTSNNYAFDKKLFSWIENLRKKGRQGEVVPHQYFDIRMILDEMRLIKSKDELTLMRKASDISAKAHIKAMQACKVGMAEYELEAVLLHEFYRQGSRYPAYTSIVAAGNNACTLHYIRNNQIIKNNELVLIDAGAEVENYAADITRTFPANGKFTSSQRAIYDLVLAAQMAAIENVKPHSTWDSAQDIILKILVQGLIDLKILKGELKTLIEEKAYLPFYMHSSGHWLGMDVHDVGEYKEEGKWRHLVPGMVFTIEPGLYISADNSNVDEKWRGIGVRIEDDIAVTENGYEVLTHGVAKAPLEIEKLMSAKG